jgi:hypothetical protein
MKKMKRETGNVKREQSTVSSEEERLHDAVHTFALGMEQRLIDKLHAGYTGWETADQPTNTKITHRMITDANLLLGHVSEGLTPPCDLLLDIANRAMIIWHRHYSSAAFAASARNADGGACTLSAEMDQVAFEIFADCYPHEAHAQAPERFWQLFKSRFPNIIRAQMEAILRDTAAAAEGWKT